MVKIQLLVVFTHGRNHGVHRVQSLAPQPQDISGKEHKVAPVRHSSSRSTAGCGGSMANSNTFEVGSSSWKFSLRRALCVVLAIEHLVPALCGRGDQLDDLLERRRHQGLARNQKT